MIGWKSKPSTAAEDKPKGFDDFDLRLGDLMRGERATLGKSLLDVQRELKIKATYIAAIENCDLSAFDTPGFVAGYVRSYARYLGMDPDMAFAKFCRESNFSVAHGMSAAASSPAMVAKRISLRAESDPFANPNALFVPKTEGFLARVEPGAVGSLSVLLLLIGAIGYGGWSVLQEVQRVQLAPVEQAPVVVAQIDAAADLAAPVVDPDAASAELAAADQTDPVLAQADVDGGLTDRLYRPAALDVPVMVSRDGPIAAIDPDQVGTLASVGADDALAAAVDGAVAAAVDGTAVQVVADAASPLELFAVRPSWVRVQSADGTVLFEKILDAGERYAVPQLEQAPLLRAGNSAAIYFAVNGQTYGPASPKAEVVKNLPLAAESLVQAFPVADMSGDADLAAALNTASVEPAPELAPLQPVAVPVSE